MPVNPLTGDILGKPGQKAPETPRKEYNPGMDYNATLTNNAMIISFQKVFPLVDGLHLSGDQLIIYSSI